MCSRGNRKIIAASAARRGLEHVEGNEGAGCAPTLL